MIKIDLYQNGIRIIQNTINKVKVIIEQSTNRYMKFWVNTSAEYNKLAENIDPDTLYFITDDDEDYGSLALDFSRHKVDPLAHGEVNTKLDRHKNDPSIHTPTLTSDKTMHISKLNGSDETGDGSETTPYKTINKPFSILPKDLGGYKIKIIADAGEYILNGISNFQNGEILIERKNNINPVFKLTKSIYIDENQHITMININLDGGGNNLIARNSFLEFYYCEIANFHRITSDKNASVHQYGGSLKNNNYLWTITSGGKATLKEVVNGTGNINGLVADGGIITTNTTFGLPYIETNGGKVFGGNQIKKCTLYFEGNNNAGTPTYLTQDAMYIKNENKVTIFGTLALSSKGGMSGVLMIGGLPYPVYSLKIAGFFGGRKTATTPQSTPNGVETYAGGYKVYVINAQGAYLDTENITDTFFANNFVIEYFTA